MFKSAFMLTVSLSLAVSFIGTVTVGCSGDSGEDADRTVAMSKKAKMLPPDTKRNKKHKSGMGSKRLTAIPKVDPSKKTLGKMTPGLLSIFVQKAVDKEDLAALTEYARRARNSKDPKLRLIVVEALGHFQEKGVSELVRFANDEDPNVQTAALQLVDNNFEGIKGDFAKLAFLDTAMPYMPDEMIDVFVSKFDGIDKCHGVVKIVSMMDDYADDALVTDALRRQYEFMTGEPFTKKSRAYRLAADFARNSRDD